MAHDHPGVDDTSAARLVDALRNEIAELEDKVTEDEDVSLPEDILPLVRGAPVPAKIAAAVDEILAEVDPISPEFAERLQARLAPVLAERGSGIVFLEQVTTYERERRQLSVGQVAEALGTSLDVIADIETGRAAFDHLGAQQVAEWIRFLELDIDKAVEALRRSMTSPATSYSGDPRDRKKHANDFVNEVRLLLCQGEPEI